MTNSPQVVEYEGTVVVGLEAHTSNALEANPAQASIPALWERFFHERLSDRVPGAGAPFGVYTDYESDHTGSYRIIAGVALRPDESVPHGLRRIAIPAGTYLVFHANGDMPQALIDTWMAIWQYFQAHPEYQRAYTVDFERYVAPSRVDVHIAVR
jgi:predicted transcriptional regulator YdeE